MKGYKKDKSGDSVITYYVNKAQYSGNNFKQFLKELALNYDVKLDWRY